MLGLPDGVRACLFDLDGVLTQTARVHAAAWKLRTRRCSRTPWPAYRQAARATSPSSWGSTARVKPTSCVSTAPTWSSRTWPTCSTGDDPPAPLRGPSLGDPRDRARPRLPLADGVRARAVQRTHRPAGESRRGRAARDAGDLPERRLRGPSAPLCGGRLWLSGGRADRGQRDGRQADPPARGRRAVRRPLRRAPLTPARPGHARGHALAGDGVVLARRAGGAGQVGTARVAPPAGRRGGPLRGPTAPRACAARDPVRARRGRREAPGPG